MKLRINAIELSLSFFLFLQYYLNKSRYIKSNIDNHYLTDPLSNSDASSAEGNGIFMEIHDNVNEAKSDATTQWPLGQLELLLTDLKAIRESIT